MNKKKVIEKLTIHYKGKKFEKLLCRFKEGDGERIDEFINKLIDDEENKY